MTPVGPADKSEDLGCAAMELIHSIRARKLEGASHALAWALQSDCASPKVRYLSSIGEARERQLAVGELWLWLGNVTDPKTESDEYLGRYLDRETNSRIKRLAPRHKLSVGTAHASLRLLLGSMLVHPPSELIFGRGPFGKPYLVWPWPSPRDVLHFNLSHTDGAVAVALARAPVGVDIEIQQDLPDFLEIAEFAFAQETFVAVASSAIGLERRSLFYRHWTLGEALIKATGGGISHDLKSFAFTSQGRPQLTRASGAFGQAEQWAFSVQGVGR